MAIKTTTVQLVGKKVTESTMGWYHLLIARTRDLAIDKDHTFTFKDRNALNKNTTRQRIIEIYETAYSELAESFHGHLERINELDDEVANLLRSNKHLDESVTKLLARLETAQRRVNGLLTVIEKEISPEIYS